jgi:arsenite methyltransferase
MKDGKEIKRVVKDKYAEIARQGGEKGCCATDSCCGADAGVLSSTFSDSYDGIEGYLPEADLGLGCGLPVKFAGLLEGQTVVDLGSGAGNDVFVARTAVGRSGRVIGVDMTQDMIEKARLNNAKLGYDNVEFRLGDIEELPVADGTADVVVSNCVINLVPDKKKAFLEIFRILKPGAHFCISDIVLQGELPDELVELAELYAGCVAGALQQNDYIEAIKAAGFSKVEIKGAKRIDLPKDVLKGHLSEDSLDAISKSNVAIMSVTVVGDKPGFKGKS